MSFGVTHSSKTTGPGARRRRNIAVAVAATVVILISLWGARVWKGESSVLDALNSHDAAARKQAAWRVSQGGYPKAAALIRNLLADGNVVDSDVREAHVYALGQLADANDFELFSELLTRDKSGYVRQSAWLSAARCDPAGCRAVLESIAAPSDVWDRIGRAKARLQLRDTHGIHELLRFAAEGDSNQRVVCGRALYASLAPALTALGRWPLEAAVNADGSWPRELVDEVGRRCAAVDLHTLMNQMWAHVERSQDVIRSKARLTGARDRIARFLLPR